MASPELEAQIAKEAEELANVPYEPAYAGPVRRCHFCGQPCALHLMKSVDGHIAEARLACPNCHA